MFHFDNSYARDLPGFSVSWPPEAVPKPETLFFNAPLAQELGLDSAALAGAAGAALFAGNTVPDGAAPIAQAYAGHQFGGFSPQLGDGRAVLLGELIDPAGRRRDLALKGSGRTPFSRGGDGRAAVGPMLREALIGEAMQALGIPTTRALAVAATGLPVRRESNFPGAVLTRVASSHIRVGTFQFFASRGDTGRVRQLADYTIARHDADLIGQPGRVSALLDRVVGRQAALIAQWMNVGFIHGVMNTDNMTLSGETIDYGPCAFLEAYDPAAVFSSIDRGGRYAFGRQPTIAQWNLARLAETLLPLLADDAGQAVEAATRIVGGFPDRYRAEWRRGQSAKLGLQPADGTDDGNDGNDASDALLADDWLELLEAGQVDFTLAWRFLADAAAGDDTRLRALVGTEGAAGDALTAWLTRWRERCAREDAGLAPVPAGQARAERMRLVNPWLIPRNHRVEEALAAASAEADMAPFEQLLEALRKPYVETAANAHYAVPAPAEVTAAYQTFCGT